MKTLKFISVLLLSVSGFGQGAHRVGQVLSRGNGVAANVVPNASIKVCVAGTGCGTEANIFADVSLTSPLSQPVVSDSAGNYSYYIASGCVDELVSAPAQGSKTTTNICPFSGTSGGGANFPSNPGIVFNTTTSAARNATSTDVVTLFGSGSCVGFLKNDGTCGSSTATVGLVPYGTLLNATTFSSLSGFTSNGTTPTVSSGKLNFTGGVGNVAQSFDFNHYTTLPQWTVSGTIVAGTASSTSYGLGFGIRSAEQSGAFVNVVGKVDLTNTASAGALTILSGPSTTVAATSTTKLVFSAGDTIQLSVTRDNDLLTVLANNVTTNGPPVTVSYQFSVAQGSAFLLPNLGRFAIFNIGGSQSVSSLNISSLTPVGADVACVGDSKLTGYYAGTYSNAACIALQAQSRAVIEAGGSDTTADVLLNLPEIIALHPTSVILNIGRNDIADGVAFGTYSTNYASAVTQLQAAGITVYNLLPLYETAVNQTPLTNFIVATYPASSIINPNLQSYSLTPSTVLASDGIHPNGFANTIIYAKIVSFLAALPSSFIYPSYLTGGTGSSLIGSTTNFGYTFLSPGANIELFSSNDATPGVPVLGNAAQGASTIQGIVPNLLGIANNTNAWLYAFDQTGNIGVQGNIFVNQLNGATLAVTNNGNVPIPMTVVGGNGLGVGVEVQSTFAGGHAYLYQSGVFSGNAVASRSDLTVGPTFFDNLAIISSHPVIAWNASGVVGFQSGSGANPALGSGLSPITTAEVALGNGAYQDKSGTLDLANITATGSISATTLSANNSLTVNGSVSAGTGIQHKRFANPCTTSASAFSTCTSGALGWSPAFANTNYTLSCTVEAPTGVPVVSSVTKSAGSFTVTLANLTAAAATGTVDCIAMHD